MDREKLFLQKLSRIGLFVPLLRGSSSKIVRSPKVLRSTPALIPNSPQPQMKEKMRSNLVYRAALKIENKFLLSTTVMQAVRKLHINSTRTEDTSNRVFIDVAEGRYAHGELPEIVPPPTIDTLVIVPGI